MRQGEAAVGVHGLNRAFGCLTKVLAASAACPRPPRAVANRCSNGVRAHGFTPRRACVPFRAGGPSSSRSRWYLRNRQRKKEKRGGFSCTFKELGSWHTLLVVDFRVGRLVDVSSLHKSLCAEEP